MMKILLADDDEVMRKLLAEVLEREGYSVQLAGNGEEAVRLLKNDAFPIIVSDIRMVELDGLDVLREAKKRNPETVVILMTGFGSMGGAIEAIQDGAFDYISKPFQMDELKALVARAAQHWEAVNAPVQKEHGSRIEISDRSLVGKSAKMVEVYKAIARAALSTSCVLISGERGTGKQLAARAIHENGARRKGKFTRLSCATLTEKELDAAGGTLSLDEVSELSPVLQLKLLQKLDEEGIRVIAATHADLGELSRLGKFREDLYYRLRVISIDLPPLRQRLEDLPDLVETFLARSTRKDRKTVSHISDEAMALLRAYDWPGNIRELEYSIASAVAMTRTPVLYPEDFPIALESASVATSTPSLTSLDEMERAHIVRVLKEVGFNKSKASEVLGIDRATLYRKAQRYGIELRGK